MADTSLVLSVNRSSRSLLKTADLLATNMLIFYVGQSRTMSQLATPEEHPPQGCRLAFISARFGCGWEVFQNPTAIVFRYCGQCPINTSQATLKVFKLGPLVQAPSGRFSPDDVSLRCESRQGQPCVWTNTMGNRRRVLDKWTRHR